MSANTSHDIECQAAEIDRDCARRSVHTRAVVCPIEVDLQRGISFEAASANRREQANDRNRILVTDSIHSWAACVIACTDDSCTHDHCEPLVSAIGDPEEMTRLVATHNRDPFDIEAGIRSFVCPVDVWLDR